MSGFTLIELILTIVVLGLIGVSILMPMSTSLQHSPTVSQLEVAIELAKQRMDIVLARKHKQGFYSYTDPCPGPSLCTPPSGYMVTRSTVTSWQSNTNFHEITVTVSGDGDAVVKTLVTGY
ncbi:MAG: type II secretion system protein [Gammaproteobacteria bacterium]|nr:type II secretion system protein [Gammaproteobacteria bacterium]